MSTDDGLNYVGTVSQTLSGRTCQHWSSQVPNQHFYTDVDMFPDKRATQVADVSNYCRNPVAGTVRKSLPWCYVNSTSSNLQWEFCNIPRCKGIFC